MKKFLIIITMLAVQAKAQMASNPAVQSPVIGIQQSVLDKNFDQALALIRSALQTPGLSEVERLRVLSVYSNLLNRNKLKNVDVGWVIPAGVSDIRVRVQRFSQQGRISFNLGMGVNLDSNDRLREFVVTKYPNTVILDKARKIGNMETEKDEEGFKFNINSSRSQLPVPAGYYQVSMTTNSGEKGEGWFIISDEMNSTQSPSFANIIDGQVVGGLPVITWNDFKSPEYKANEWRGAYLSIGKLDANLNWTDALGYSMSDSNFTSVEVGKTQPEEVHTELPLQNGNYMAILGYNEVKKVGKIKYARRSDTRVRFTVLNK
jgi:hypothetical protein